MRQFVGVVALVVLALRGCAPPAECRGQGEEDRARPSCRTSTGAAAATSRAATGRSTSTRTSRSTDVLEAPTAPSSWNRVGRRASRARSRELRPPGWGSRRVTRVGPARACSSSAAEPPWSSATRFTRARPRPLPLVLVEKKGSKARARASAESPGPSSSTATSTASPSEARDDAPRCDPRRPPRAGRSRPG